MVLPVINSPIAAHEYPYRWVATSFALSHSAWLGDELPWVRKWWSRFQKQQNLSPPGQLESHCRYVYHLASWRAIASVYTTWPAGEPLQVCIPPGQLESHCRCVWAHYYRFVCVCIAGKTLVSFRRNNRLYAFKHSISSWRSGKSLAGTGYQLRNWRLLRHALRQWRGA